MENEILQVEVDVLLYVLGFMLTAVVAAIANYIKGMANKIEMISAKLTRLQGEYNTNINFLRTQEAKQRALITELEKDIVRL